MSSPTGMIGGFEEAPGMENHAITHFLFIAESKGMSLINKALSDQCAIPS